MPASSPTLLDQVRTVCRTRHYSVRTERAYVQWIKRFIYFHGKQHPRTLNERHVRAYLSYLATERSVAASTQNQALNALVFLYRHVLERGLGDLGAYARAKRPKRLPVVLTPDEVDDVLARMRAAPRLVARLLYGAGLRLKKALRLQKGPSAPRAGPRRHLQPDRRLPVVRFAHVTNQMATVDGDFEKGEADGTRDAMHVAATARGATDLWKGHDVPGSRATQLLAPRW